MPSLIKPPRLRPGDTVATVSLSWGGAGDENILWRYQQGKARLETRFGLRVVEMPHTLAGTAYAYEHPQERAADLMQAFTDPCIQAIFCCIGGEETIRLLPYIDFAVIRRHPKIFMGYSDTTVNHLMCWKAGLSSFYGPAVLSDFAENLRLPAYTEKWVKKALFSPEPLGQVEPAGEWTAEFLRWDIENQKTARRFQPNGSYRLLQGNGTVTGRLLGGCLEVFDWLRGTPLFPDPEDFNGAILFLETSEEKPAPKAVRYMLRSLGAMGLLDRIHGMVWGKPYEEAYREEYAVEIQTVLKEYGREALPVLTNLSFGHCEPKCVIPYGALAQIDCESRTFSILENAVV